MVYKEIIGNELYVYLNGSLLYKRWLNEQKGIIIQGDTPMGRGQGNFKAVDVWQHIVAGGVA